MEIDLRDKATSTMPRRYLAKANGMTVLAVLALIMGSVACSDVADENPSVADPASDEPAGQVDDQADDGGTEAAEFELLELEDIDGGRVNARLILEGQPNAAEIEAAAPLIVEMLRDEEPYSGATAFLYDRPEYAYGSFTLGRIEDAPQGNWADAFNAPVGDYDSHELDVVVYERDWSQQPTAQDAERYLAYDNAYFDLEEQVVTDADFDNLEENAVEHAADELGVSVEEIQTAIDAVFTWQFSGSQ